MRVGTFHSLLLLDIITATTVNMSSSPKAVAPRQAVTPWPLALPPLDSDLRTEAEGKGVSRFFSVWEKLATTDMAEEKTDRGEAGFTAFTVSDKTWQENIPEGPVDPLDQDPVLQKLLFIRPEDVEIGMERAMGRTK